MAIDVISLKCYTLSPKEHIIALTQLALNKIVILQGTFSNAFSGNVSYLVSNFNEVCSEGAIDNN